MYLNINSYSQMVQPRMLGQVIKHTRENYFPSLSSPRYLLSSLDVRCLITCPFVNMKVFKKSARRPLTGHSSRNNIVDSDSFLGYLETSMDVLPVKGLQDKYTPDSLPLGVIVKALFGSQSKTLLTLHITADMLRCVLLRRTYLYGSDLKETELILKLFNNALHCLHYTGLINGEFTRCGRPQELSQLCGEKETQLLHELDNIIHIEDSNGIGEFVLSNVIYKFVKGQMNYSFSGMTLRYEKAFKFTHV